MSARLTLECFIVHGNRCSRDSSRERLGNLQIGLQIGLQIDFQIDLQIDLKLTEHIIGIRIDFEISAECSRCEPCLIKSIEMGCLEMLRGLVLLGDAQTSKFFNKEHCEVPHVISVLQSHRLHAVAHVNTS